MFVLFNLLVFYSQFWFD